MPVILEQIHTPTNADWNDLSKIHQDTATTGLTLNRTELEQFLHSGGWILAGRFNDRIVGTILAQQQSKRIMLSQAAVRTITQRRGVMHQLMQAIQRWADQEGLTLVIHNEDAELATALQHRGFQQIGNNFTYNNS